MWELMCINIDMCNFNLNPYYARTWLSSDNMQLYLVIGFLYDTESSLKKMKKKETHTHTYSTQYVYLMLWWSSWLIELE